MSVPAMISLFKELSGYDEDLLATSREDFSEWTKQPGLPEWNRAQWLGAAKRFLTDLERLQWPEINSALNSVVRLII